MKFPVLISGLIFFSVVRSAAQNTWTLRQCIDRAVEKNIYINQNKLSSEINKLTLQESKGERLPDLNLADAQNFSFGRSVDPYSNQYVDQEVKSNNVALSSNITLFNGFQIKNTIRQDQLNLDAGNADVETAKNEICLDVVAAYLQMLFAYENVGNAISQVEASNAQTEKVKKYYDIGKVPESSLLQVQSQLSADKYALVVAENQLQNSKVTLMQLIELPVTDSFDVEKPETDPLLLPEKYNTQEIYSKALDILPQVKSATLKTESASYGVKISRSMVMPKLVLGGSLKTGYSSARENITYQTQLTEEPIGYLQNDPTEIVLGSVPNTIVQRSGYSFAGQFKDNFSQLIGLGLTVPLFNNRHGKTGIEKAKVNSRMAELNEQNIKNTLRKNIEQAVTDVNAAERRYAASREQFASAAASYSGMEKKFNIGLINSTDFLTEKNNYIRALSNQVQSKYDYIFKIKVVDYYSGKPLTF